MVIEVPWSTTSIVIEIPWFTTSSDGEHHQYGRRYLREKFGRHLILQCHKLQVFHSSHVYARLQDDCD